jgi:hypothetical protein
MCTSLGGGLLELLGVQIGSGRPICMAVDVPPDPGVLGEAHQQVHLVGRLEGQALPQQLDADLEQDLVIRLDELWWKGGLEAAPVPNVAITRHVLRTCRRRGVYTCTRSTKGVSAGPSRESGG